MPTVCLEKSTPKNNIARKEYNKLIGELNNEIDRLSTQNKSLIEKLAITEDQITVGRRNERDLGKYFGRVINYYLEKKNRFISSDLVTVVLILFI